MKHGVRVIRFCENNWNKSDIFVLDDKSVHLLQGETAIQLIGLSDPDFMLQSDLFGEKKQ